MNKIYKLYTDGACRGNGKKSSRCAIGCVIEDENGIVGEISEYIGEGYTNNECEYMALLRGIEECATRGVKILDIYVDSKLVAEQIKGNYKINKQKLKKLCFDVRKVLDTFDIYTIQNIPRRYNQKADSLANEAFESRNEGSGVGASFRTIDEYFG